VAFFHGSHLESKLSVLHISTGLFAALMFLKGRSYKARPLRVRLLFCRYCLQKQAFAAAGNEKASRIAGGFVPPSGTLSNQMITILKALCGKFQY
jgi:hypothetical protein